MCSNFTLFERKTYFYHDCGHWGLKPLFDAYTCIHHLEYFVWIKISLFMTWKGSSKPYISISITNVKTKCVDLVIIFHRLLLIYMSLKFWTNIEHTPFQYKCPGTCHNVYEKLLTWHVYAKIKIPCLLSEYLQKQQR